MDEVAPSDMTPLTKFEKSCLMPIEEWLDGVRTSFFIDYDGYGDLATATHVSNVTWRPSMVSGVNKPPKWATHICWYNK